jgi:hypothetical protein
MCRGRFLHTLHSLAVVFNVGVFASHTRSVRLQVLLTKSEVKALKGVRPRGLALLGVKPLSWLRPWYQMNHAYFVYPYEKDATGSTAAFVALHTSCLQRELCAVVRYVSREGVPPVLGVLLPQQEVVEDGTPPKQVGAE